MKRHIISYWKPETALNRLSEDSQCLHELEPYGRITIDRNDEVWLVSVIRGSGELYLIGHITVGRLTKTHPHLEWHFHITAKRGTVEELGFVSLIDEAPLLRFQTKLKGADRLTLFNGRVDATQFASPRHLLEDSAKLLAYKWSGALTKDEMIEQEREHEQTGEIGKPNPLVEEAAINLVTERYESLGWRVHSVESENRGYDLLCTKGRTEEHVEVKGLLRSGSSFIMTVNEVKSAETDPLFRIAIVRKALSTRPDIKIHTGSELQQGFNFLPLEYRVTRR